MSDPILNVEEQMLIMTKAAQLDLRIAELRVIQHHGPAELRQLTADRDAALAQLQQLLAERAELVEIRRVADDDLATAQRRLEQSRANAKRVTTQEQAEASKVEIHALEGKVAGAEEQLLRTMDGLERIDRQLPALQAETDRTGKKLDVVEKSAPGVIRAANEEIEARLDARNGYIAQMTPQVRRMYQTAASRGGNPLTVVLDKTCQTCFAHNIAQHIVEIEQGRAIHHCVGCKRIIAKVFHED
jgi:predicted  nucleic acid-binding Zn-ribbon protein